MKRVLMHTVPHSKQRYPTVGDYEEGHGFVVFSVSDMGNEDYEALVLIHELVEYLLVKKRGIKLQDIDLFDQTFEAARELGEVTGEPGDDKSSPYRREHRFAENIERQVAHEMGVDWSQYDKAVGEL